MTSGANRLRVLRAERRVSQLALATLTRIHPTRVWKIENAYVVPRPNERQAIALALGVSESDIWSRAFGAETTHHDDVRASLATEAGV